MDTVIVTTESQLIRIVENAVGKYFKVAETPKKEEPEIISGSKAAVHFLCEKGYEISPSLFTKQVAAENVPCRRFHNKRLLFNSEELIAWAESMCEPVGQRDTNAALTLARSANRKLRGGRK